MKIFSRTRATALTAVIVPLAVLAAACGSGGGEGNVTAAAALARIAELEAQAAERAATEEAEFMSPGAGVRVRMARASWSTGYMQAAIYHHLLEELGYSVSEPADAELAPAEFYTALAQGDYDLWANSWYPLHDQWLAVEMPDGSLVREHVSPIGEQMRAGGLQGYLTNKSMVIDHDIKTLDQIANDPELIALYDAADANPGDGIVQVLGCPEEWTCDDVVDAQIEFAGWETIEQVKGVYEDHVEQTVAADGRGEPYITYTWTPSAVVTQLVPGFNSVWLAVEESSVIDESFSEEYVQTGPPAAIDTDACSNDPCYLGFLAADIQVTANDEFLLENPAARELLELVRIPLLDVAQQNVSFDAGANTTADVNRHAADWIRTNRELVDEWLTAAREAA